MCLHDVYFCYYLYTIFVLISRDLGRADGARWISALFEAQFVLARFDLGRLSHVAACDYLCTHARTHTYTHKRTRMHACMHARTHARTNTHTHIMYVYMHASREGADGALLHVAACDYLCVCTRTQTHTDTHTSCTYICTYTEREQTALCCT
jgi:hypothetical protein